MQFSFAKLRKEGDIAVITLSDPPANTLTYDMVHQLDAVYQELLCDPEVRGLMLIGAGEKFFSGGVNIGMLCSASHYYNINFVLYASEIFERIANGPLMVTAAINGNVTGGGLEVGLIAAHRFAVEGKYNIGFPEVRLGVIPGLGGTQRLKKIVGTQVALELITNGEFISAERALELGIVEDIFPTDSFKQKSLERTKAIVSASREPREVALHVRGWSSGNVDVDSLVGFSILDGGIGLIEIHDAFSRAPAMDALYALDQSILDARMEEGINVLLIAAKDPSQSINRLASSDPVEWAYARYIATRLENYPKICSCLWAGVMHALGAEFAFACDYRFAVQSAEETRVEVSVLNTPERLERFNIGPPRGDEPSAEISTRDGITRLSVHLPGSTPIDAARTWLGRFLPPQAASISVGYAKLAIVKGQEMSVHAGMQLEQRLQEHLFRSEDGREGMKAYLEKRSANFTGS